MNAKKIFVYRFFIIVSLLIIFICISALSYAQTMSSQISDNVFRLHVIANSDSNEDQELKYKVRDSLIKYMNSIITKDSSKEEVIKIANNNIENFYTIANNVISESGYDYPICITIENCEFPTKYYGDVTLPAGSYDALRVKIGDAEGQNWWCVMFPPLCFVDISSGVVPEESKSLLKNNLDEEEYALITADTSSISKMSIKFKIVELIENIKSDKF